MSLHATVLESALAKYRQFYFLCSSCSVILIFIVSFVVCLGFEMHCTPIGGLSSLIRYMLCSIESATPHSHLDISLQCLQRGDIYRLSLLKWQCTESVSVSVHSAFHALQNVLVLGPLILLCIGIWPTRLLIVAVLEFLSPHHVVMWRFVHPLTWRSVLRR